MSYEYDFSKKYGGRVDDEASVASKLNAFKKAKTDLLIEEGELLEKALQSKDPRVLSAAQTHWNDIKERSSNGVKSEILDPNQWSQGSGYKMKNYSIDYSVLRRMAKTPVIKAIVGTRQTQVSAFSQPQSNKHQTGFVIRKKREYYTDEDPELSAKDKAIIKELTTFVLNCGTQDNAWGGDNFDKFLKKLTRDCLEIDQGCFEVVRDRSGMPVEFLAVDGATFRIADTYDDDGYHHGRVMQRGYYPSFVQLIDGHIVNEYYPWELCFGSRNQSTNIYENGYGQSEIEELISIITYMLYADAYNGKFFSQGASPKGIIKINSGANRNRISEFRQQWMSMVAGTNNAWKVPILEADTMEFIDLQKSNTDMQFKEWQEYLVKIACAIFKISPEEIGLGEKSGGLQERSNEHDLKFSKDKGLKPLLKSIQFWINKWIINAVNPDFELIFVGLEAEGEMAEIELDIKKVSNFMGVKEIRRKHNLPEELEEGDVILNQVWLSKSQSDEMAGEQADNTEAAEGTEDVWEDLGDDVAKAILDKTPQETISKYADNPLIQDAFRLLIGE